MNETGYDFVTPDQLRVGLYVELELGWMAHPFPKGSFKISSERQIETIRGLGLKRVRFVPAKSDPLPEPVALVPEQVPGEPDHDDAVPEAPPVGPTPEQQARQRRAALIGAQQQRLALCDQQFGAAISSYRNISEQIKAQPTEAAAQCREMVDSLVGDVLAQGESSIRLLSESMGDRAWMHPVNVTILSLLLGKALGLQEDALKDLAMAAFLHDIGKTQLPDRVRWVDTNFSPSEYKLYQDHVAHGVVIAKRMELSAGAMRAIAQHHEMMDGSGFPLHAKSEALGMPGKILALVNRYENMCNPARPSASVTPHEALSLIFSQFKPRFDDVVLAAFIRMMGVYPPGSVVQLSDERFALVVSVNSARPLKPRVIVHEPAVPKDEALIMDLELASSPGIRRSLKPAVLPRAAIDYLSPRARVCYFFERAVDPELDEACA